MKKADGKKFGFLLDGISASVDATDEEVIHKAKEKMKRCGIPVPTLHFRIYKKAVDARHRDDIHFVCTVLVESEYDLPDERLQAIMARRLDAPEPEVLYGTEPLSQRPLVVGMGPAGLFSALLLAQNGYRPILIDRGAPVEERAKDVATFRETGILNPDSNIQFGAGGAGTFSDGKLITRIHDPKCGFVLQSLVNFGAPEDILQKAKPHIGTDLLRVVVANILREIERLGGEIRYHCRMEDFSELPGRRIEVRTNCGTLFAGAVILAIGHSSRDTYRRLIEKDFAVEAKPISVGVRVEHLQSEIDQALYGSFSGHPNLGHAEYALSDTRGDRGVYSFCMCPGGEVVAAASEEGHLVVNGMSYHARNGKNANAAIAVSVHPSDFEPVNGSLALGAIAFQRKIERAAFLAGGGEYVAPIMTMGDFLSGKRGTLPTKVQPSYRDGKVRLANFEDIFPSEVLHTLSLGFRSFGKKIKGYDAPEAILTAAETRTSAPIRILRDPVQMTAIGHNGIYPCGEGAGYAGGITSAGVDGVRTALALMKRFSPFER